MRRTVFLTGILLVAIAPAAARAQTPIPEGSTGGAPHFVGATATPNPITAPPLAPQHPFLAPNGRSNIHDDAYMSDAYTGAGPLGHRTDRRSVFEVRECASVTFDSHERIETICVGLDRPVLQLKDPKTLKTLASMNLPPRQPGGGNPFGDFTGGGYFYLDDQNRAVLPTTTRHVYVVAQTPEPGFRLVRDVDLNGVLGGQDKIVSVLPDWSGRLWFVTQAGVIGTIGRDADVVHVFATGERITNSFAVDEDGGVYVVTDGALYRFDAQADGTPAVTWRQTYDNTGVQKPGQVNAGSGTTPTLITGGLIAITDNADPMNVVVYQRGRTVSGPREICRQAVFSPGASATDNSLIAAGNSIVVENNYGYTGPASTENGKSTAPGVERVDFDVASRTCRKVWHSDERSPTVVPKLSLATGLVYIYVKEPQPSGGPDLWYLTALDFRTGRTVYKVLAGEGLGYNNNYAPVTLGPDRAAYVGVLGGLVRLRDVYKPGGDEQAGSPGQQGSGSRGGAGSSGASGRRCLGRRLRVNRRGIGPVHRGMRRKRLRRLGARRIGKRAVRICVRGRGNIFVALGRRGRARLVLSTARGHSLGHVHPRSRRRAVRRAFPRMRRVMRSIYRSAPRGRTVMRIRHRRVRWVAIGPRRFTRRALRRDLRAIRHKP